MFTPERARRTCDARALDAQGFGVCVSEQQRRIRDEVMSAVNGGRVEDLAHILRAAKDAHSIYEAAVGTPDPDWPRWYAEYLLGVR